MTLGEINEGPKKVFPLFQRPSTKPTVPAPSQTDPTIPSKVLNPPNKNGSKKKATAGSKLQQEIKKGPLDVLVSVEQDNGNGTARSELLTIDPNNSRRKRRKTASPSSKIQTGTPQDDDVVVIEGPPPKARRGRPKKSTKEEGSSRPLTTPAVEASLLEDHSIPVLPSTTGLGRAVPNNSFETPLLSSKTGFPSSLITANGMANSNNGMEVTLALTKEVTSDASIVDIKPKKILRFNPKTGTIGSPPPPKSVPTKEAGRKATPKTRIVTICYGENHNIPLEIGRKIEDILNGLTKIPPTAPKQFTAPPKAEIPPTNIAKPKPVHPLFTGKATGKPSTANQKPAEVTPNQPRVSPRKAAVTSRIRSQAYDRPQSPTRAIAPKFSGFGNSTGILKFPGAVEPAWPWEGINHVRGETGISRQDAEETPRSLIRMTKKGKYQAIEVLSTEDIISRLATSLNVAHVTREIQEINLDEFSSVPQCLRIPDKHYEGGTMLQKRSRKELSMKPPFTKSTPASYDDDELQQPGATQKQIHPAISRVYNSIATSLSAFDQGICETQSWVQKYAPRSASEVLQQGREAMILREWLESLTVKAVETKMADSKSQATPNAESNGKRKRKSKKLDGFVISSDEDFDLDEITDPEDDLAGAGGSLNGKKTVVRPIVAAKDSKRLPNAVVISGPHGCGKTAAVYAVAKELEFEVFEINSGSRRSGKDILEKVGDMSKNHLVQQSHNSISVDEENLRIDEALAKDIESGRQGTMNSFFKKKEPAVSKAQDPKPATKSKKAVGIKKSDLPTKPPMQQKKQSLILIEEADIIYDEDKLFWSTILALVAQSKRPVIITCNNESAIPLQSLLLHAIIRFTPPPVDLAVDYMLSVAACEGHVVKRDAVRVLYETRGCDLRGSLMELNFWCQFAIGDVKGGLDWSYPRWPDGSDVDQNGEKVRVISEGTYQTGMGWLSQDILESHSHYLNIEEEMLHEAWDGWNLDAGDWQKSIEINSWAKKMKAESTSRESDIAALGIYVDFTEAMSVADICSGGAFGSDNQILIDIEQPVLTSKAREDYILAYPIVEALPKVDFGSITKSVSLHMKSRARKIFQEDSHIRHDLEVPQELSTPSESELLRLITKQISAPESQLRRIDFSLAFDPISEPEKAYVWSSNSLEASSFDRTITMIALDLAPYVRSIVACDARLQQDRARLSNLLSEGGRQGKRMRTTRAAMSALEGGARRTTRKERYFGDKLNKIFVLYTGMESWLEAAFLEEQASRETLAPDDVSGTGGEGSEDGTVVENGPQVVKKVRGSGARVQSSSGSDRDELGEGVS
ncbi:hypothetical protein HYFRA_00005922 [Hymenoscyphus fraxineus]|uniref:AAA+ ATPase domain-containing protein n=1 Tax=Hymenoscyphus fraxineus TaxID=746836 RepID=A0A9N9KWC7_9HELO|nr:hypothetical protein HYFRA_00005922 [Hymenoscyphus fraxineus]